MPQNSKALWHLVWLYGRKTEPFVAPRSELNSVLDEFTKEGSQGHNCVFWTSWLEVLKSELIKCLPKNRGRQNLIYLYCEAWLGVQKETMPIYIYLSLTKYQFSGWEEKLYHRVDFCEHFSLFFHHECLGQSVIWTSLNGELWSWYIL